MVHINVNHVLLVVTLIRLVQLNVVYVHPVVWLNITIPTYVRYVHLDDISSSMVKPYVNLVPPVVRLSLVHHNVRCVQLVDIRTMRVQVNVRHVPPA